MYIHHIAVTPQEHRHGVGETLMQALIAEAGARSITAVRLDSWAFNIGAHAFFETKGFSPLNIVFERQLR